MDIVGKQHEDRVGDRLKSPHTWTRETFPESSCLKLNPDVAAAVAQGNIQSGFDHYELFGGAERRRVLPAAAVQEPEDPARLEKPHFVRDYERHVHGLMAAYPLDEAMSLAVGGSYEETGVTQKQLLQYAGLQDGMSVIDLGCGSGRLAHALGKELKIEYCGLDIVEALLSYARTKTPPNYRFILNTTLSLPLPDQCADFVSVFSVFTHLRHAETYVYLTDMRRVLKPNGRIVFSFLEFAQGHHWDVFEVDIETARNSDASPLNTFIERSVNELWCRRLGFTYKFQDAATADYKGGQLGQSVAILQKCELPS